MRITDLKDFYSVESIGDIPPALFVIKSQDQIERREKMIANLKTGALGRTTERPVAKGLVIVTSLLGMGNKIDFDSGKWQGFDEPRHILKHRDRFFLSTIDSILILDSELNIIDKVTHPFFAFLHTLAIDEVRSKLLVVSSGYDAIFEIDIESHEITWEWFGWEHGLDRNKSGIYCTRSPEKAKEYKKQNKEVLLVDPKQYSSYGLPTDLRTTHPNAATYGQGKTQGKILFTMGIKGAVGIIDKSSGECEIALEGLAMMPHGIKRYEAGWMVTNTLKGELWLLDDKFGCLEKIILTNLGGKAEGSGKSEWVQQIIHVKDKVFLALDANRGLIFFDLEKKQIAHQGINPSWCVQDCIFLGK